MNPAATGKREWWWLALVVAICGAGLFFRCANLGGKVWWFDEAFTALRVAGFTRGEVEPFLYAGPYRTAAEIQRFQHIPPDRSATATIRSLAQEEPQHPPLYYVLTRWWAHMAGDSPTALRWGAVLLSLLAIPGLWWLGRELWPDDQRVTQAAFMLWAVSPFFMTYAQEAREYGLWAALTLLASASLLRSLRTNCRWWCYGLLAAAGLYTDLLFVLVLLAHGAFLLTDRQRRARWKSFSGAVAMAVVLFSPWLVVCLQYRESAQNHLDWVSRPLTLIGLAQGWEFGMGAVLFDYDHPGQLDGLVRIGIVLVLVVAFISLWRRGDRRTAWLATLLIAANALPLAGADVLLGGHRSTVNRFLTAAWLGELLVLAWWAARHRWVLLGLALLGITANVIRLPAETWWNKYQGDPQARVAALINAADRPLVLTSTQGSMMGHLLTLSHRLHARVRTGVWGRPVERQEFSDVFFLGSRSDPSDMAGCEPVFQSQWIRSVARNRINS